MKTFKVICVLLVIVFLIVQIVSMSATSNTEKQPYTVLKKFDGFEIRKYNTANFSYIKMNANSYKENAGNGFKVLAGYIFGGNERNESISMTSPVTTNLDDDMTMQFMLPSNLKIEDLPKPNSSLIQFKTEPEKIVAAITFGGWSSDEKIEEYIQKLKNYLSEKGIKHTSKFSFLGYNPPYELLNRKNEIIVEIDISTIIN